MAEPTAVLFDMDGTLIDSEPVWFETEVALLAELGYELGPEHWPYVLGQPNEAACKYLLGVSGLPLTWQELSNRIEAAMVPILSQGVELLPGAKELLVELDVLEELDVLDELLVLEELLVLDEEETLPLDEDETLPLDELVLDTPPVLLEVELDPPLDVEEMTMLPLDPVLPPPKKPPAKKPPPPKPPLPPMITGGLPPPVAISGPGGSGIGAPWLVTVTVAGAQAVCVVTTLRRTGVCWTTRRTAAFFATCRFTK